MKTLEMKEAREPLAQYAKRIKGNPLILTASGKPIAALVSTETLDWETISLSMNPKFIGILESSRKSYKKRGGLSTEETRIRLGMKKKSKGK